MMLEDAAALPLLRADVIVRVRPRIIRLIEID